MLRYVTIVIKLFDRLVFEGITYICTTNEK